MGQVVALRLRSLLAREREGGKRERGRERGEGEGERVERSEGGRDERREDEEEGEGEEGREEEEGGERVDGGEGRGLIPETSHAPALQLCTEGNRGPELSTKAGTGPVLPTEGEIDYVSVLNRALPPDIRILGWSPAPEGFSARFSCVSREYRYYFPAQGLDIQAGEG